LLLLCWRVLLGRLPLVSRELLELPSVALADALWITVVVRVGASSTSWSCCRQ
jgi:hypothetical protein